jgi:hypothetical protein
LKQLCFTGNITISINNLFTETHIYLPTDLAPLPLHTIIEQFAYSKYSHLPLKSHNYKLALTNLDKYIFGDTGPETQTTTVSPTTNSMINNMHTLQNDLTLRIATHNVQGYNSNIKRLLWEDYCLTNNLHIISITETKISNITPVKSFNTQHFTYYWANSTASKEGTGLMIRNNIRPHIHNVLTHPGGAIALDIFFKHDYKFRIISVYLSSTNSSERKSTQDKTVI